MGHAHQTGSWSFSCDGQAGRQLLFEGLDDGLRRIVFEEEAEVGFIIVDEAAEGRNVDISEVAVHDVLYR